ncbi:MAG: threonine-phosphate decarboxylase CobD [Thermodesulfobacteriota bacterium]
MTRPVHGGNIREVQDKYGLSKSAVLDFSASISPFGPPQGVKEVIKKSIDALPNYPDSDCLSLRQAIAGYWRIAPDNILVGNGSTELIHLIARVLTPKQALIPIPTFTEYEDAVRLAGGRCLFIKARPDKGFSWPMETILGRLDQGDLLFLCTPNSPTGYLMPEADIYNIIHACKKHKVVLVIDETFLDFVTGGEQCSFIKLAASASNIIVLRSFTKLYALPGLRLGYLVGGRTLVKKIGRMQPPWMVNTLAQAAGIEAIKDRSYAAQAVVRLNLEKEWLIAELSKTPGLLPYPSAANFILCRIATRKIDSAALTDEMAKKGILIRNCSTYQGLDKHFIRVAVRTREENARLISSLREVLNGL